MEQLIEINTNHVIPPEVGADLFANRTAVAQMQQSTAPAEVSIIIQAYNHLDKTKRCVESVIKYSQGIDYELILVDNGSEDGILEYFKSVRYSKKKILHITKNLGASYPVSMINLYELGRYICFVACDLILTPHWLENLLICMKSDPKIGLVNPVSSNTSNLQEVILPYNSYEDMQRNAEKWNHSDSRKWEDRLRIITLGTLYRKEALLTTGWPLGDVGFFHDFGDDDIAFRIRRMGYRVVLAGDTWICHDHDFRRGEGKDSEQFNKSLTIGRTNFQEKYFGIDAWEDVNNYYLPYEKYFPSPAARRSVHILGVDVKCGTPILDMKNYLRTAGIFETVLSAFTQDPKYWTDLKTICEGPVFCDREEFLSDAFLREQFDYVIADRPLNRYHEPQKVLNDLFALCKKDGIVACKVKNTYSFQEYVHLLGQWGVYDQEFSYNIPPEVVHDALSKHGKVHQIIPVPFALDDSQQQALASLIPPELLQEQKNELLGRMLCREYLMIVKKA